MAQPTDSVPVLADMQVLDLSQQLPGPYATFLLASLGATVVKVEPPGGDPARSIDPDMFAHVNAGKRSVFLDLKSDVGRGAFYELADSSDVIVEGFRPGVTARLGCDYSTMRERRPGLVYCSISGMGQAGPLAGNPTHDLSLQAMVGALRTAPTTDRIGVPWVDLATGTTAALAIVAAWQAGRPAYLDMSMLDAARSWTAIKPAAVTDAEATYGIFDASDGRVVVALLEDAMWRRLCEAFGWTDWRADESLATYPQRRAHAGAIRERLEATLRAHPVDHILGLAQVHDLPIEAANPVHDPRAADQLAARGRDEAGSTLFSPLPLDLLVPLAPAPPMPANR